MYIYVCEQHTLIPTTLLPSKLRLRKLLDQLSATVNLHFFLNFYDKTNTCIFEFILYRFNASKFGIISIVKAVLLLKLIENPYID